jgi:hypothetical protein
LSEDNKIHTRLLSKIKHTSLFEYDMENMHVKENPAENHLPAQKLQLIPTTSLFTTARSNSEMHPVQYNFYAFFVYLL